MTHDDKSAGLNRQSHRIYLLTKRILDFLLSFIAIIGFVPIWIVISILIKLDSPGPVFVRQMRIGRQGKPFDVLKFRTMYVGDDEIHKSLPAQTVEAILKLKNDPRVTPIGRILRKYSLNELPLLLSVLRGDMSLVGPRPALPYELAYDEDWYKRRLEVTPGLVGVWQLQRTYPSNFEEMAKLDIWYIEHQSLWLDLRIILETIPASFGGHGAY
ncbi:MAG: sugar transferase [Chloroflexi bacterium]|nr:sugar transferase [Chloroflexota bacterium]